MSYQAVTLKDSSDLALELSSPPEQRLTHFTSSVSDISNSPHVTPQASMEGFNDSSLLPGKASVSFNSKASFTRR